MDNFLSEILMKNLSLIQKIVIYHLDFKLTSRIFDIKQNIEIIWKNFILEIMI